MPATTVTLEITSPAQEALLRQYLGMLQELEHLADTAPDGQVLDQCEGAVVARGQEANRQLLERLVQRRLDAAEKKGRRCGPAGAGGRGSTAGRAGGRS